MQYCISFSPASATDTGLICYEGINALFMFSHCIFFFFSSLFFLSSYLYTILTVKPLVQLLVTDHTTSPSSTSSTSSSYVTPATFPSLLHGGARIVTGTSSTGKKAFTDVILKEGTNVTLTCLVTANPNVTSVKWYYNQKLFKTVPLKGTLSLSTLTFTSVNCYSCK